MVLPPLSPPAPIGAAPMKRLLLLALLLIPACKGPPISYPVGDALLDRVLDSVVVLGSEQADGSYYSFCSGVSIERGLIMTAYHCVDQDPHVSVAQRHNPSWWTGTDIVYVDPDQDLAILRPRGIMTSRVGLSRELPGYADRVLVVGHPSMLRWSLSEGIVAFPKRVGGGVTGRQTWMQFTATVDPGSSGGAVTNRYGELIGIVSFGVRHMFGAVHLSVLEQALAQVE